MLEKFTKKEHKKELRYFKEWYNEEIQFYILSYLLSNPNYHAVQKITTHAHDKCKGKPYYDDFWMVLYNTDYLEIKGSIELETKNIPDKDKKYRITSKGIDSLKMTSGNFIDLVKLLEEKESKELTVFNFFDHYNIQKNRNNTFSIFKNDGSVFYLVPYWLNDVFWKLIEQGKDEIREEIKDTLKIQQ